MNKIKDISLVLQNIETCEIKKSKIHGYGLFAKNEIQEGIVLNILDGQYLKDEIVKDLKINIDIEELNYLPQQNIWLIRGFLTSYSAINHSENNNIKIMYEPLRIVAIKDIKKDEEILLNYKQEQFPDYFIKKYNIETKFL